MRILGLISRKISDCEEMPARDVPKVIEVRDWQLRKAPERFLRLVNLSKLVIFRSWVHPAKVEVKSIPSVWALPSGRVIRVRD